MVWVWSDSVPLTLVWLQRHREGLQKRQEKEMRKYTRAPQRSAAAGALSAAYLEAADEDAEEGEDYNDGGLTASERARQSLARPRRDARDEVRTAPPAQGALWS